MAIVSVNTDINIDLNKNKFTNDVGVVRDVNSVRQSLINIILTIPGEKPFNRGFGTRIEDFLFDNFDYSDSINTQMEIRKTVEAYEPRIEIENVYLSDVPFYEGSVLGRMESNARATVSDSNQLYIYISYFLVKGTSNGVTVRDQIQIGVKRVR
jgi:phage baseplate assembly protein W